MKIPKLLIHLSNTDNGELTDRALKLCEESGEVAEAALRLKGRKNNKGYKPKAMQDHVIEEAVDVMIMSMDILNMMCCTDPEQIDAIIHKKLKKWQRQVRNQHT